MLGKKGPTMEMWSLPPHLCFQKLAECINMTVMPHSAYSSQPGETGISPHKYRYVSSVSRLKGVGQSEEERPRFISWPLCTSDCITGYTDLIQSSVCSCELGIIVSILQKRKLRPKKIKWLNHIHQGLASLFC